MALLLKAIKNLKKQHQPYKATINRSTDQNRESEKSLIPIESID